MANTVEHSDTQAATLTTEHSLFITSGAKTYVCQISTENMVAGDEAEFYTKEKPISGGSVLIGQIQYVGPAIPQEKMIKLWAVPGAGFSDGVEFCLKQTAGTGRNFPFTVLSLG